MYQIEVVRFCFIMHGAKNQISNNSIAQLYHDF